MLLNSNSNQKTNLVKNIRVCKKGEDKYFLAEYINRFLVFDLRENRNTLKVDYDSYLKSVEIDKDTFDTRFQYPAFYILNLYTSRKRAFDLTYGRFILNYDKDKTKNILRGIFEFNINEDRKEEIIINTKTGENYEIITEKFEVVRRYIPEEFILSSIYEYCWEDDKNYLFKENNLNIYRNDAVILCDSNSIEEAKIIEKILRKNNYHTIKIKFYEKLENNAVETIKCIRYSTLLEKDEHESINQKIVHYYLKTNDKYKIAKYILNNKEIIRMFNEKAIESFIKKIDKFYNDFYDWDNVIKYPTSSYLIEFMEKYFSYLLREETENVSEDNTEKEKIAGGSYEK